MPMMKDDGREGSMGHYTFVEPTPVYEHIPNQVSEVRQNVSVVKPDLDELVTETSRPSVRVAEPEQGIKRVSRNKAVPNNRRSIRERARSVWTITKVAGLTVGALLIAREVHDFGFDFNAEQNAEVTVGAADNDIREDVYVNLAEISSTFPLEVKTSLNRPGPINCDMTISMNKKGHEITAVTNAGVVFDQVDPKKLEDGTYQIDVQGGMKITPSFVDWTKTPIQFDSDLKYTDRCYDMNEPNSAMNIAVIATQQAGQLATACAIGSKEGETAIINGIKEDAKSHGDIPEDVPNSEINVNFPGLNDQQDAVYGRAVQNFDEETGKVIEDYIDASPDDHKVKTNFDDIKDCDKHTFTYIGKQTAGVEGEARDGEN